ncbi:MAG: HAD family hydrolase [Planctomycetota bacterium]
MPRPPRWPTLSARHVLIDMDYTITYPTSPPEKELLDGLESDSYFLAILRDLLARSRRLSRPAALKMIRSHCDPDSQCLFTILDAIGIAAEEYWQAVLDYHRTHLAAYPDALDMIRELHSRGFRIYTATTNSRMAALSKLACAGLATLHGSPYFSGFFGGDICEGGKSGPRFFRTILKIGRLAPADCLMVGDDPQMDLASAKAAGIRQVVLPQRNRIEELVVADDGGIYVNSLSVVPKLLRLKRPC